MASYFALHKDFTDGNEFKGYMGYGFKPDSSQNWFRESDKRVYPRVGSFVYMIQRQKGDDILQLVGKFKIVDFINPDLSKGEVKTHRAKFEELIVPSKPIYFDEAVKRAISQGGFDSDLDNLIGEVKKQNASFRQPLEPRIIQMLDWLLGAELSTNEDTDSRSNPDNVSSEPVEAYKKAEILVRQGQERFRKNVEKVWKGKRCVVTGVSYEPLLIASHIVRFSDCKNNEHWDGANGMFLTAHIDALFDKHLITFVNISGNYKIKFSKQVDLEVLKSLNITEQDVLNTEVLASNELEKFERYMLEHNKIFNDKNH